MSQNAVIIELIEPWIPHKLKSGTKIFTDINLNLNETNPVAFGPIEPKLFWNEIKKISEIHIKNGVYYALIYFKVKESLY